MKNREPHEKEINAHYSRFDQKVSNCNASDMFMSLCAELYDRMDKTNQEYGFWDARQGLDADALYYVAEHAVESGHAFVASILKMEQNELEDILYFNNTDESKKESVVILFSTVLQNYMNDRGKIRFHVLEPHPDDALGSASGICYNPNVITTLHTLTISGDDRDNVLLDSEGRKRYSVLRKEPNIIRHERYMLSDLHYNERIIGEEIAYTEKIAQYQSKYPEMNSLRKIVKSIVSTAQSENAYLALPMGLEHPMHILTMLVGLECIDAQNFPLDKVLIYVDHPYDFDLIGTDRVLHVRSYIENRVHQDLLRCDDLGAAQPKLSLVIETIYGEKHYGEFAGTLNKTFCSYFISKATYEELVKQHFHLQCNRILFITSQAWPYYKTGGLGEVAYSYCKALRSSVDDVRILMPGYPTRKEAEDEYLGDKDIQFDYECTEGKYVCNIEQRKYDGLIYYFLKMEDSQGNQVSFSAPEKIGKEYAMFCDALLQRGLNSLEEFVPTICHCNDWQTGLIPFLKKTKYRDYRRDMKVLYTIHFYGYKGIYPKKEILTLLGMDKSSCKLCFYCTENGEKNWDAQECILGKLDLLNKSAKAEIVQTPPSLMSFMRAGIEFADAVSTVSKGYAEEIQGYPDFRGIRVSGVRNGVPSRVKNFALEEKRVRKEMLQRKLGLEVRDDLPLLCMVSRLAIEKGINTVNPILPYILKEKVQFVIVGDDSDKDRPIYSEFFKKAEKEHAGKFAYREYDKELEFDVYKAADIVLMPSLSEACGTTQMLAMQYGAVPVVSMLRSFRDTVLDFKDLEKRDKPEHWGKGVGFYAYVDDCWVLFEVLKKAIDVYRNEPEKWEKTRKYCFDTDFSWRNGSIYGYQKIYNEM